MDIWGNKIVAPCTGAWIEIKPLRNEHDCILSHPARVRGLKYQMLTRKINGGASHPARVRGLKSSRVVVFGNSILSHPARVRGLKFLHRKPW